MSYNVVKSQIPKATTRLGSPLKGGIEMPKLKLVWVSDKRSEGQAFELDLMALCRKHSYIETEKATGLFEIEPLSQRDNRAFQRQKRRKFLPLIKRSLPPVA
ncbi:hypothetical protein CO101_02105 [Candidatus Berkelbacteria bacterium CG_4_9_14_3_um_filter_39_23]|uniref:Uncharacterized protein n=1 Tax=Candidatus Berkelbacteria bacterium CG_4_9_14_3_um_filter_39_23 TaxID=1974508 RepID=A0A2M8C5G1_9BACT|nr:MAG: hypothetical protein CO101_02105 [Candidatus Berkelbacteria bacterium CG_4_9_14_3_um_filter_39_23]